MKFSAIEALKEFYRRDFKRFAEEQLFIKTDYGLKRLNLNGPQLKLNELVLRLLALYQFVRLICLKPRQVGTSTICEAYVFWRTVLWPYTNSLVAAHDNPTSETIFEMQKTFLTFMSRPLRPMIRHLRREKIGYDVPLHLARKFGGLGLKSETKIATGANIQIGRGHTLQAAHLSEIGSYDYGEILKSALYPAIHDVPNTFFFMEGTATGANTFFHKEWQAAVKGESLFTPFFVAWFEHKGYATPLKDGEKLLYTPEEDLIMRHFQLSPEQIKWRRKKLEEYKGDEDMFRENYPMDDKEAWRHHGKTAFSAPHLKELRSLHVVRPLQIGKMIDERTFVQDSAGSMLVWAHPEKSSQYYIGVDVAWTQKGDLSAIEVVKKYSYEQMAEWTGRVDEIELAEQVDKIGRYYNNAQVAIETNGRGKETARSLVDRFEYPNPYLRRKYDEMTQRYTKKVGWETTTKTKQMLLALTNHMIRQLIPATRSQWLMDGLDHFTEHEGSAKAAAGYEDDRVMAWMIALMAAYQEDEHHEQDLFAEPEDEEKKQQKALDNYQCDVQERDNIVFADTGDDYWPNH